MVSLVWKKADYGYPKKLKARQWHGQLLPIAKRHLDGSAGLGV